MKMIDHPPDPLGSVPYPLRCGARDQLVELLGDVSFEHQIQSGSTMTKRRRPLHIIFVDFLTRHMRLRNPSIVYDISS